MVDFGCEHHFCEDCIKHYLQTMITDGIVGGIKCAAIGCQHLADEGVIKRLVSKEVFKRYEMLMLKAATKDMDDIVRHN